MYCWSVSKRRFVLVVLGVLFLACLGHCEVDAIDAADAADATEIADANGWRCRRRYIRGYPEWTTPVGGNGGIEF